MYAGFIRSEESIESRSVEGTEETVKGGDGFSCVVSSEVWSWTLSPERKGCISTSLSDVSMDSLSLTISSLENESACPIRGMILVSLLSRLSKSSSAAVGTPVSR